MTILTHVPSIWNEKENSGQIYLETGKDINQTNTIIMFNIISKTQALKILLGLLTIVIVFHMLIVIRIIPYEIVWAGKLKSVNKMYVFEIVSILVNLLLLTVLLLKAKFIKHTINDKIIDGIIGFFVLVFALNTIGNLLAKSLFEKAVFTPLTLISAILLYIIVRKDKNYQPLE